MVGCFEWKLLLIMDNKGSAGFTEERRFWDLEIGCHDFVWLLKIPSILNDHAYECQPDQVRINATIG